MIDRYTEKNFPSLEGKIIALSGSTGGLGRQLCRLILSRGGRLILIDRNPQKQSKLMDELAGEYPNGAIYPLAADMEDILSVKVLCERLKEQKPDVIIHNAGAYDIPRHICSTGYDNVFQINFVSPYYITRELAPLGTKIVVVGSIAHNYSKTDEKDTDFRTRRASSLVYGNAKRYSMFAHLELAKGEGCSLAVTHPGITMTGITDHYPKWLYAIIKHPMKLIFMSNRKAALSIMQGIYNNTDNYTWIGPKIFNVWGYPSKKKLTTCKPQEISYIFTKAEEIYNTIKADV